MPDDDTTETPDTVRILDLGTATLTILEDTESRTCQHD